MASKMSIKELITLAARRWRGLSEKDMDLSALDDRVSGIKPADRWQGETWDVTGDEPKRLS